MSTETVVKHHLDAIFRGDFEGILSDYSDDAVLFHTQGTARGIGQIREYIGGMGTDLEALVDNFKLLREDVDGEVMYILWTCGDVAPLGTDTYIVRDEKIVVQTFATYPPNLADHER